MRSIAYIWDDFVERHPKLVKWIREGGLFVLVSNLITVLKATPHNGDSGLRRIFCPNCTV